MTKKENQVVVKSTVKAQVGINVPDLRLKREWAKKGAVHYIDRDDLAQAIYEPGVEYMFKTGILYIENMQDKIYLGLEPDEAQEPTNIIVLDDAQKKRYLTVAPVHELKALLPKLSHDQKNELANYAIELEVTDMPRCELLKEATEIDVIRAVIAKRETAALEKADNKLG